MLIPSRDNLAMLSIQPRLMRVGYISALNLDIYAYDGGYEYASGEFTPYIPDDHMIIGVPGRGKRLYGAITQLEADRQYHTFEGQYVPKVTADEVFNLDLRGAQDVFDSTNRTIKQQPVKVMVVARPKEFSLGKMDINASTGTSNKFEVLYIKISVDGNDRLEYDKYNFIYKVGDKDYLADMRDALGLS